MGSLFYIVRLILFLFDIQIIIVHHRFLSMFSHCLPCLCRVAVGFSHAYGIAFEINKEAVLPVPLGDRAALDLGHVQIVVDKMGQNVVQGSALMGDFQTQADLVGIFAEDLLVRHNDETGGVAVGIVLLRIRWRWPPGSDPCPLPPSVLRKRCSAC